MGRDELGSWACQANQSHRNFMRRYFQLNSTEVIQHRTRSKLFMWGRRGESFGVGHNTVVRPKLPVRQNPSIRYITYMHDPAKEPIATQSSRHGYY